MLSNSRLYRCLIRVTEKVHDLKRPRARVLSRRAFTHALALVAFGGVARPASPRVRPSRVCECDADGQCTGGCEPNVGPCQKYQGLPGTGKPAGSNCWCQQMGAKIMAHVCDCYCPGAEWEYCTCHTIGYAPCNSGWLPDQEELI